MLLSNSLKRARVQQSFKKLCFISAEAFSRLEGGDSREFLFFFESLRFRTPLNSPKTMPAPRPDTLPTRASLLVRLKDWDDHTSWHEFHDTYSRLIHNFALKQGVAEDGAKDIVQETLLSVAKAIREFQYDPQKCSFKSWLLSVTRNRVTDHFRRHPREREARRAPAAATVRTSTIERVPDPRSLAAEDVWEEEWRRNVVELALEKLKAQVSTKHFQIFYLHVIKQQSTSKVAKALGVSVGQVYLVKHRLKGAFEKAVKRLEQELDASPERQRSA